jgi:hypothetical protein
MAIIVDPDNLDRAQVIFGTDQEKISLFDVGGLITTDTSGSNGESDGGNRAFFSSGSTFQTDGVAPGDVLCIFTTSSAGHYEIATVDSETQVTVLSNYDTFSKFVTASFEIREPTGGTIADGVTLQALYSFCKEEWRSDSAQFGGDDLIRHTFPFEAITSEQFEIGGGDAHTDWTWFEPSTEKVYAEFTKKFIRTGGWADKQTDNTTLNEWTGIITLGSLDADTQVYFQQLSASATPEDFKFLGAVNEPIFVSGSGDGRLNFLKLFARKKGKTYAQSAIADIGVSEIKTIVNRFPLAHVDDPAIVATDAQILGTLPFRGQNTVTGALDGQTAALSTAALGAFTSSDGDFVTLGIETGDTLLIGTGSNDTGYWTISTVDSATTLTIDTAESGPYVGATGLDFEITTTKIVRDRTDDGAIVDAGSNLGYLSSSTGGFTAAGVAVDDLLIVTEPANVYRGVYKISTVLSDAEIRVDTTDKTWSAGTSSNIDYRIVEPGMYLQYKEETITIGTTDNLSFENTNPDRVFRQTGDWSSDGVSIGSVVTFANSTSNNGSFTVGSIATTSASNDTIILVATDTLTAESASSGVTTTAFDSFKRDIAGTIYAFHWRILGNNSTLGNIYQFVQHQLRQTSDIDFGPGTSRGDVTDLLMSFSTPTATLFDAFIDDLDATDTNNATFRDATGVDRVFAFVSVGSISFNVNLQNDGAAEYFMFFTNDDAGDDLGRDFGTPNAIIVQDENGAQITGSVSAQSSVQFTYDYDNNDQRGTASKATDAPVTVVAIGLNTAQYVIVTSTIQRTKANNISLVASLERNYSNP